ncbi:MAG: DinB family protein [Anaerolineales bacterium]|nr:DinB family protein [Anaerolineales bacterium]
MNANQVLRVEFEIIGRQLAEVLKGLSWEQITYMPNGKANSVGFLAWHTLLTWDGYDSLVQDQEEIYQAGGWQEKFGFDVSGRGVEGSGMGTGFSAEDVALVRPRAKTLRDYHDAVAQRTLSYLENASAAELAREMVVPWWPNAVPTARVLIHIIGHSFIHIGEAWATRDLVKEQVKGGV